MAETEKSGDEIGIGVADIEQILHNYWRTPRVKAELERYKTGDEFRQKQDELEKLEREGSGMRFGLFRDTRTNKEIQERRDELRSMAEEEAKRARRREKEAVEELLTDIRRSAETVGRSKRQAVMFDTNTPYILYMNSSLGKIEDVTDDVIEDLNFR